MKIKFLIPVFILVILVACNSKQDAASQLEQKTLSPIYIGDSFRENDIEAKVISVEKREYVGAEGFVKEVSKGGVFVVVQWEYKNVSDQPISAFDATSITLLDANDNEYKPDIAASASFTTESNTNEKILSDLNPGLSVNGAEVFEVAKDKFSDSWKLRIGDSIVNFKAKSQSVTAQPEPSQPQISEVSDSTSDAELQPTQEQTAKPISNEDLADAEAEAVADSEAMSEKNPSLQASSLELQKMNSNKDESKTTIIKSTENVTPSFDCLKARTLVEKTICNNPELAQLDVNLNSAYKQSINSSDLKYVEQLKVEQRAWLKERNKCDTEKCLEDKITSRWEEIAPWDFEKHD